MISDWDEVVLSDAIDIIGGGTPKTNIDEYWNGDIPWLSVVDFNDSGRFVFDTEKTITKEGLNNSSTKILNEGDIIISARGTVGALAQLGKPMAFNQSCYGIRAKQDQYVNDFLYYLLVNTVNNLKRIAHGGVFDTITRSTFDNITVRIPSITKQIEIASILGSLDKKIHLNQLTNETLEAMAQAIFKSWFVDFDPVRAKIEANSAGRDPNRAAMAAIAGVSLEMDWNEVESALDQKLANMTEGQRNRLTRTAQLFPDELVESEIGEVPNGWGIDSIFNQAEYINGAAFKGRDFSKSGSGLPVIKIAELKSGITNQTKFTEKEVKDKYYLDSGDILFSWSGNPDTSIDIFIWEGGKGLLNQHIFKIESDSKTRKVFNYYFLKSMLPFFKRTAANKQTTGLGHVTQRDLKRKQISVPSTELINEFSKQAEPIFDLIFNNLMETQYLSKLRDTLLPKLISGEMELNIRDYAT